ncbi:MAG: purine-binding chemotaxis protein CheW [Planctomycetes bacterium]|nr:purine-binding chemotaxis protein CheW [Planctomycetota bacterium]
MTPLRRLCSFRLDPQLFGIDVDRVQEVVRTSRMTAVPLAPPGIAGLINLRGQVVAAFDLRVRLKLPGRPAGGGGINIIVRSADGPVGLLVDEIRDVIALDERTFEPPPETLGDDALELIGGAYKLKDRLLLALDLDRALSTLVAPASAARTTPDDRQQERK